MTFDASCDAFFPVATVSRGCRGGLRQAAKIDSRLKVAEQSRCATLVRGGGGLKGLASDEGGIADGGASALTDRRRVVVCVCSTVVV